jgi:acetylornithine deacetylase/succinyl-diaminopimelate desuccinylase-like protein
MSNKDLQALDAYFVAERIRHLEEYREFLRIPSVSALPSHREDMMRAADWVEHTLRTAGVPTVEILPTQGHPVVYGAWPAEKPGTPTLLLYAHYDTQPTDPLNEWTTPPFEPTIRDGRMYARGASDDKGNLFLTFKVVEAYSALRGRPPIGLIFLFEGEEEIGSPNLRACIQEHKERLRADAVMSADSVMWANDTPSLVLASKGLIALQIDVRGAESDLHSGLHGGLAPNPLNALTTMLGSMWTLDGKVQIEEFYDEVRPLSEQEQAEIAAVPFDEASYARSIGIAAPVGEPGYGPLERNWARPTLDINGIWGGFQGEGNKTVIAREAHAKITCRLVPDQVPSHVIAAIERHIKTHCPAGITATVQQTAGSSSAFAIAPTHPVLRVAREALHASYNRDPLMIHLGGTLPVAEYFQKDLGQDIVFLAWSMPDEHLHGPDEFFRLENFDRGLRVYADLFERLSEQWDSYS